MPKTISPQVILITGCSSGFGLVIAVRLAAYGHRVFATMRDPTKKEPLLVEAQKRGGAKNLTVLPLDVTRPETIKTAVTEIVSSAGVIDVLINNAGFGIGGFFEDLSADDYQRQLDVNFLGVLNVTREVLPVMRPRRQGKIINISSMLAFSGTPCLSAYCSSKWALEGFSECLYMELRPLGINVVLAEPGSYRTKIFEDNARYGENFDNPRSPYYETSRRLQDLVRKHALNNHRDIEDVAIDIQHIVESKFPSFRNIIGIHSCLRYLMVRIIPFELYAWFVSKVLYRKD